MSWDCYEYVSFDHVTERYALRKTCMHDCHTYQCIDEDDTDAFIRWLTDEEVQARYPNIQS